MEIKAKNKNVYDGCIIGTAIGDALGYPLRDMTMFEIQKKYGKDEINDYLLEDGLARISDNTQLVLFTINGLLIGTTRLKTRGILASYNRYVGFSYKDWLITQGINVEHNFHTTKNWLCNVPRMFGVRYSSNTCVNAFTYKGIASYNNPINNCNESEAITRAIPVGLYMAIRNPVPFNLITYGAETVAVSHGHPLCYISGALMADIIAKIAWRNESDLKKIILSAVDLTAEIFNDNEYMDDIRAIINKALELAESETKESEAIALIGSGKTADEALAIGVYCAYKHIDNFEAGVIAAVNHDGNSAATGAIAGSILGTYLGADAIPTRFFENLELKDVIQELSNDLFNDCPISEYSDVKDEKWESKYIRGDYAM